jgi:pimeloyl-ACP methyl ester carboxylesterase
MAEASPSPEIAFDATGLPLESAPLLVVWGHGWGMDRKAFRPLAETLATRAAHLLVDFPGFGQSSLPPPTWTTADYADAMAAWLSPLRAGKKLIWAGHSFGCRVGIQLAARHPDIADGLFLLAGAGLQRKRSLGQKIDHWSRVYTFKILKHLAPLVGYSVDKLRAKFGSTDYRNAGLLRQVFMNVIREDLTAQAKQITCPVQLVYGADDRETPPEIGERLRALIPRAALSVLPGQDHYTVLGEGRHIVARRMTDFMTQLGG